MQVGLSLFQSCRFGRYADMTHARTTPNGSPFLSKCECEVMALGDRQCHDNFSTEVVSIVVYVQIFRDTPSGCCRDTQFEKRCFRMSGAPLVSLLIIIGFPR